MTTDKSVSFRSDLVSNTIDLIAKVGWQCLRTSQLIAGLVSQLAVYKEEGVSMTPSVFICNSIAQLVQLAGVGEHILLSAEEPLDSAGPKILKAAAPLCSGNWRIYIERSVTGETCTYGVFCGTSDPSSMTIDEVVLDEYTEAFPVIRISQSATNKVEVRTNAGDGIEFRFNNDTDVAEINIHEHINMLSRAISNGSGPQSKRFSGYIARVLSTAIRDCHGTLIAVIPSRLKIPPKQLADSVLLDPPLHLYERFQRHIDEGKTAASVSRLQTASELMSGFISSDGITIFNDAGYIIGYRAFVSNATGGKPADGGARSRAFETMRALVGSELTAAFFRSQDGRTDFVQAAMEELK